MVATSDVTLPTPRNPGLPADHVCTNVVMLETRDHSWLVAHGTGVSYCWRGWTLGKAHAIHVVIQDNFKETA